MPMLMPQQPRQLPHHHGSPLPMQWRYWQPRQSLRCILICSSKTPSAAQQTPTRLTARSGSHSKDEKQQEEAALGAARFETA
jgi:hypothetical protein